MSAHLARLARLIAKPEESKMENRPSPVNAAVLVARVRLCCRYTHTHTHACIYNTIYFTIIRFLDAGHYIDKRKAIREYNSDQVLVVFLFGKRNMYFVGWLCKAQGKVPVFENN